MFILRPLLAATGAPKQGKMVIGTVKGDIHDIGKNLVGMMMEGAGFEVIDLGINNAVEKYLAAIEEHDPDIIGMSALLTTTMPYMKVVVDTLKEKGLRDKLIVMVGGAPLNEEFGKAVGADAYCRDAAVAVETAKDLIKRKHNQMGARELKRSPSVRQECERRTAQCPKSSAAPAAVRAQVLNMSQGVPPITPGMVGGRYKPLTDHRGCARPSAGAAAARGTGTFTDHAEPGEAGGGGRLHDGQRRAPAFSPRPG